MIALMIHRAQALGFKAAAGLEPRTALRASGVVIALLGALGILFEAGAPLAVFDLDVEGTVPTAWSGGLLFSGGGLALLLASLRPPVPSRELRWLRVLGAVLVFMGLDEGLRLHENIDSWLQFDWQPLYLPLVLVAGSAWLVTTRVLRRLELGVRPFVAGAGCWVAAQLIEVFQHEGRLHPGLVQDTRLTEAEFERETGTVAYVSSVVTEEMLEMTGSLLFALALLAAVRAVLEQREGEPPGASRRTLAHPIARSRIGSRG